MSAHSYKSSEWDILEAMSRFGGSFVKKLAELYRLADMDNKRILQSAFQKYFIKYDDIASRSEIDFRE